LTAASLPCLAVLIFYILSDPFGVIRSYSDYNKGPLTNPNRDVISSEIFLKNYPTYKYKSFIFGNSKTLAFLTTDWAKYINDSVPYHFDASLESLYGILTKLNYLDKNHDSIKNVLIVADEKLLENIKDTSSLLYIKDYKIAGTSVINYHLVFFNSFLNQFYFVRYTDYLLFKKYRPYMNGFLAHHPGNYTSVNNDLILTYADSEIISDSLKYYNNTDIFYHRSEPGSYLKPALGTQQIDMLNKIKALFEKHNTSYKIIISPSYSQQYLNENDLKKLKEIFGEGDVFDFSGENSYTDNIGNYYDDVHYKPYIGRSIMKKIYAK